MATEISNIRIKAVNNLSNRINKRSAKANNFSKFIFEKAEINRVKYPEAGYSEGAPIDDYASEYIDLAIRQLKSEIIKRAMELELADYQKDLAAAKTASIDLLTDIVTLQNHAE